MSFSKIKYYTVWIIFGYLSSCRSVSPLNDVIRHDKFLAKIAADSSYKVQIIYTSVNLQDTTFVTYQFHVDEQAYFYPASTVKLPITILALQKLNELKSQYPEINKDCIFLSDSSRPSQSAALIDTTHALGQPTVGRYIEKIFLVSDNDAYNRLYEFLGQEYINNELKKRFPKDNFAINHRVGVSGFSFEENRYTNPVRIICNGSTTYQQTEQKSLIPFKHSAKNATLGNGFYNASDSLVRQPFDFSKKNFIPLPMLHGLLQRIMFPELFSAQQRFNLTKADYSFLKSTMSSLPKNDPFYHQDTSLYDSYVKFIMFGDSKESIPDDIRIYNKVGDAYGFLTDIAYIENKSKGIGFFLSVNMLCNRDGIFNDGIYEYDSIGLPFFAKLGRKIYSLEEKRVGKQIKR